MELCPTCGAEEGTGKSQCPSEWGGDHPETKEFSHDWAARCQRVEKERDDLRAAIIAYIHQYNLEHEDDCPEDDTCECPLILALSAALEEKKT